MQPQPPPFDYEKLVLENVADIIVVTDLQFKVLCWNRVAESCYGIAEGDALGRAMRDLVKFDYLTSSSEEALHVLKREGQWRGEVLFIAPGGRELYLNHTVKYATDCAGVAVGVLAVGRDITAKKNS